MWYQTVNESDIFTPAVLVYPDRVEENIRQMIRIAGSVDRLRPHVKSHKMAEIIELQVELGITKFKCATLSEMRMVAEQGGLDILLAYPLLGPDIFHFLGMATQFPEVKLSVTVDAQDACTMLSNQISDSGKQGLSVGIFVDIDNGMHRTGIQPQKAIELIHHIISDPNLHFEGLHIYDGHVHESDLAQRKVHCEKDFEAVGNLVQDLKEQGVIIPELACGGTPTFPVHALDPSRTLCPGTTIFWDAGYATKFPDLDFLPAAVLAGRVISKPMQNICIDLGHKSVASEMPHPRLKFMDHHVNDYANQHEEHLVVSMDKPESISIGDLIYALPIHVCPTIALHENVYVVRDQKVVGKWEVVARKRTY